MHFKIIYFCSINNSVDISISSISVSIDKILKISSFQFQGRLLIVKMTFKGVEETLCDPLKAISTATPLSPLSLMVNERT